MSTSDGLVRFDGLRFRIFNRQNTPALTTNGFSFFALLEDRQGCLWAGTLTGGAVRYCNGAFTSLTVKDGLPNNTVVRIDEDEAGTVWIFTNPGLAKWQNGHLIRVAPEPFAFACKVKFLRKLGHHLWANFNSVVECPSGFGIRVVNHLDM